MNVVRTHKVSTAGKNLPMSDQPPLRLGLRPGGPCRAIDTSHRPCAVWGNTCNSTNGDAANVHAASRLRAKCCGAARSGAALCALRSHKRADHKQRLPRRQMFLSHLPRSVLRSPRALHSAYTFLHVHAWGNFTRNCRVHRQPPHPCTCLPFLSHGLSSR